MLTAYYIDIVQKNNYTHLKTRMSFIGGGDMKKHIYSAAVIASGCLWGLMGLFRRSMGSLGFDSFGIVFVRCGVAALLFALTILIRDKSAFRVKLKDFWCFIGSGLCSLLFFSVCYFQAMTLMSLSAAAILLYTAPCFVVLMSALLFQEKLNGRLILAVFLAFSGCCLVSGLVGQETKISLIGLLYGLGSGFGYALYSIFGKLALRRGYASSTINFYSCLLAALGAGLIFGVKAPVSLMFSSSGALALCLLAGVVTSYLPYLLYTFGLSGIEAGKASVMASVEPVVATLVGVFVYRESLNLYSLAGIALVLFAVLLTGIQGRKKSP